MVENEKGRTPWWECGQKRKREPCRLSPSMLRMMLADIGVGLPKFQDGVGPAGVPHGQRPGIWMRLACYSFQRFAAVQFVHADAEKNGPRFCEGSGGPGI